MVSLTERKAINMFPHPYVESLMRALYFLITLTFILVLINPRSKHRSFFIPKIIVCPLLSVAVAALCRWGFLSIVAHAGNNALLSNVFNILFFLICASFAFLSLLFIFEISPRKALFLVSVCCLIEHLTRNISAIIKFAFPNLSRLMFTFGYYFYMLFDLLIALALSFLFWFLVIRKQMKRFNYDETLKDNRFIIVCAINLFVCVAVSSFTSFTIEGTANDFTVLVICPIYAILCCFLGLYLQVNVISKSKLESEKKTLDVLIERESQKNMLFSKNMDALQIEIHDLKKRLQRLEQSGGSKEEASTILKDFNEAIDKYNIFTKTGNPAIDSLLSNYNISAIKEEIDFTYFVDGKLLDFMEPNNVIALFDNLLSNAFEAVLEEEKQNRIIHLQITNEKQMVMIVIRNYSSNSPHFEGGTPITSKNKKYHGYGIKSIKRIVRKYNGEVKFGYNNNFFISRIIFPESLKQDD